MTTSEGEWLFPAVLAGWQFDLYDTFGQCVYSGRLATTPYDPEDPDGSVSTGYTTVPGEYRVLTARVSGLVGADCVGTLLGALVHTFPDED